MSNLGLWGKAVATAVAASFVSAQTALQDGQVEMFEWVTIVIAGLAVLAGVKIVKNASSGVLYVAKFLLAIVLAALGALATAWADQDGVTTNELLTIGLAVLAAVPTYVINDSAGESDQIEQERAEEANRLP